MAPAHDRRYYKGQRFVVKALSYWRLGEVLSDLCVTDEAT